jgi:hypothetical protein
MAANSLDLSPTVYLYLQVSPELSLILPVTLPKHSIISTPVGGITSAIAIWFLMEIWFFYSSKNIFSNKHNLLKAGKLPISYLQVQTV